MLEMVSFTFYFTTIFLKALHTSDTSRSPGGGFQLLSDAQSLWEFVATAVCGLLKENNGEKRGAGRKNL